MPVLTRDEVVSKTARASAVQSGSKKLQTDPGMKRLVPLNGGDNVYLRHPRHRQIAKVQGCFGRVHKRAGRAR